MWPPIRSSWYAVLGIMLSREQSCRTAEPVIIMVHLTAFTRCCCFEVATVLFGAANADAHIVIDKATVASFVTVAMTKFSSLLTAKARKIIVRPPTLVAGNVRGAAGLNAPALHYSGSRRRRRAFRKPPRLTPTSHQLPTVVRR